MPHIGSTVILAALGNQVTSEVLPQVHFLMGPSGPQDYPVVISQVSPWIDIFSGWQNSPLDLLICGVRDIMEGQDKQDHLTLFSPHYPRE